MNLAAQLINDGWKDAFDVAVVVSNDSDLVEPMRIVKDELKKKVGLMCPHEGRPTPRLKAVATFVHHVRPAHLRDSQFPERVELPDGKFAIKPSDW